MDMVRRLHPLIRRFVAVSLATLLIVVAFASDASARHRKPTTPVVAGNAWGGQWPRCS